MDLDLYYTHARLNSSLFTDAGKIQAANLQLHDGKDVHTL